MPQHPLSPKTLLLGITLAASPAICAQEMFAALEDDPLLMYGDDELISIATGTYKPVHLTPAVASIISANDLKAMGATHLDEALELIPGIHVYPSHLSRMTASYSIRGIHTGFNPQVLLTINGVPIAPPGSGGRFNRFRLPIHAISRIEVIRGPGSAVHGSDAFAGVINVVTKQGDEIQTSQLGGRTGSFDSKESWLQTSGEIDDWQIAFTLEHSKSDGDDSRIVHSDSATAAGSSLTPAPIQSMYNILTSSLDIRNDEWSFNLWNWNQRDAGTGSGGAQAIDLTGRDNSENYQLAVQYSPNDKIHHWKLTNHYRFTKQRTETLFTLLPPGTTVPIGDDGNIGTAPNSNCPVLGAPFNAQMCLVTFPDGIYGYPGGHKTIHSLEIEALNRSLHNHAIRLSIGAKREKIDTFERKNFGPGVTDSVGDTSPIITSVDGTLTDVTGTDYIYQPSRTDNSWFLSIQDEWQFAPDWELTTGLRHDHYSIFGDTFNPRLALVWAMHYNLTSKLLLGTAFRAPSLNELFIRNNPAALGNPELQPEKITTVELAFDYHPTFNVQEHINLFAYKARDLIAFTPVATGTQAANLNEQTGYGIELESTWTPREKTKLVAAFTIQHSENDKTGRIVPYAPGRQLSLSATHKYRFNSWLFISANWVGDRARAENDTRPQISDYTVVNANVSRQISRNFELAIGIRNLFDEDVREPSNGAIAEDFPMEGRSLFLEMRYNVN